MVWTHSYASLYKMILLIGLPLVHAYHLLCSSIFLSTAATDANLLEEFGNTLLIPTQYLFVGKTAYPTDNPAIPYRLVNTYDYQGHWVLKTVGSTLMLPSSLFWGSIVKGLSYLSEDTRQRQAKIEQSLASQLVLSNNDKYRALGLAVNHDLTQAERIKSGSHPRKAEDQIKLADDKKALKAVAKVLEEAQIPYWVDCGTCLGVYRHGGNIPWDNDIDIAILEPDSENVKRALNKLNPEEFAILDWSSRDKPNTLFKVYVKGTDALVDIYHYRIDPKDQSIIYILSNEDNIFMSDSWRERELLYTKPIPHNVVFPLKKGTYDGIDVLVPNDIVAYLQSRYGENLDPIMIYNPETDSYEQDLSHPYWKMIEEEKQKMKN